MKIHINCPECSAELQRLFAVDLEPKNDCVYEIECPRGHRFRANVLYHEFQKLFEVAVNALADNYYREAIGSFAASYERFMELFIRIVMKANGIPDEAVVQGWKKVSRQSERQLGAFIILFIAEFKENPRLISETHVNLRNKVVHQGYFPTREECITYGTSVLSFIQETITLLHDSEKHQSELIGSINDQGDFSPSGPKYHYYAYHLIGTNRPPSDTQTLQEMLAAAIETRKSRTQ
jgi:hypothetical protein